MHTFEHEIAAANEARIQKRLEAIYEYIAPMRGERATKVTFWDRPDLGDTDFAGWVRLEKQRDPALTWRRICSSLEKVVDKILHYEKTI